MRQPIRARALGLGLALLSGLLWVGCGSEVDGVSAEASAPPEETELLMVGRVEPRDATQVRSPQNTLVVGNWRSWGGWIKLVELAAEGKEVKTGESIARFQHDGERALPWVQRQIAEAEANAERSRLDRESQERLLLSDASQRDLDRQRAQLNLRQAGVIARRTLKVYELDDQLAQFEAQAVRLRIAANEMSVAADENYQRLELKRAHELEELYHKFVAKFDIEAPHDGVVRHAYNRRHRRKVEKGDGMPAGMHIISLARNEDLSVRVFVPEHLLGELEPGDEVVVIGLDEEEWPASVKEIDPIPQQLSFLRQNEELPNGQEKAYGVLADFTGETKGISAGIDVKVRLP